MSNHPGDEVTHRAFLNDRVWHRALLTAALAGGLAVSGPVFADVPPATGTLTSSQQTSNKLLADAQKAIQAGNGRLALISLKNALTADPQNSRARVTLGILLNQMGDGGGAERELRQARKDGAPPALVLPALFDVMLARDENQILLTQFPEPAPNTPEAATILMARAMALQGLKRPTEAVEAIDHSLAIRRDARGLLIRARIALQQGQIADARKFLDEAIPKATTPEAMLFKSGILLSARENQAALDLINQLLEKYPGNLQGRFARIEAYIALNQDDKAKPELDDILAKYPNYPMGIYYRALLLQRSGDSKGAWNMAQNLPGELRDSQPRIALTLALMAKDAGNEDTAASILGRLLLKVPNSAAARLGLASIRLRQHNAPEALKVLTPVKDSSDLRVQEQLANTYIQLNRGDEALTILRKLDADGKAGPAIKRSIALLEIQGGHADQGIKDLTRLASKEPGDPELAAPLIGALVQAKRFPEALAVADKLGSDPKQRVAALVDRGGILTLQKDDVGAQAAFDKAVESDPKSVRALLARAEFLASMQKFPESDRDLNASLSLDPKNLGALLKLADNAMRQGRDRDVRTVLGRAIVVSPQSSMARIALIRYLMARRDFKSALPVADDFSRVQPGNGEAVTMLGTTQLALG
ncbi:MAG TPA: tetratricopeptide repeat protein, partial [Rhizomicrobium sp.]|nr:tetratricopeptide repeat protein [Rhizomicrobium sp.]